MAKLKHYCLNCHGSGWYNRERGLGCFRCGGNNYPSRQGSGIDPISSALCINEKIFNKWVALDSGIRLTMVYTGWSKKWTIDYLHWMETEGLLFVQNGEAIDSLVYDDLMRQEQE